LFKKLLFSALTVALALTLTEAVLTALEPYPPPANLMIFEDSGRTVHFDPLRGHRLTAVPSRWARIVNGELEFLGTLRGNSEGFADRDDFSPARTTPGIPRFAVFGDSYTAGQYIDVNWPDRAEELARDQGRPVEYLNFAIDGGGLGNWHRMLTGIVEAENYELDGVIFAVFFDNLRRTFTVMDHRGYDHYVYGRIPTWNPAQYPRTLEQARGFMHEWEDEPNAILGSEEFDGILRGEFPERMRGEFRLALTSRVLRYFESPGSGPQISELPDGPWVAGRRWMYADIRRVLEGLQLPAYVVYLPWRDHLLAGVADRCPGLADAREFADDLGAEFLDATDAFREMSTKELRSHWLPVDGHWNQRGSDRLAAWIVERIPEAPE
jgi:hypothetical protein